MITNRSLRRHRLSSRNAIHQAVMDVLESRQLMSGNPLPAGISKSGGVVYLNASDYDDIGAATMVNGQLKVSLDHMVLVNSQDINTPPMHLKIHDGDATYDPASVTKIEFLGGNGNDAFTNSTAIPCTANGNDGNDVLVGGSASDQLNGGKGDDQLKGNDGDDAMNGGGGDDTYVFAGFFMGSDLITEAANADSDTLDFSDFDHAPGPNPVTPGGVVLDLSQTTQQELRYAELKLTLSSSTGIENVTGSGFADSIKGNSRNNVIHAGGGADSVDARGGADWVYGENGNDLIHGGSGNDFLSGGDGNDVIYADSGNDSVNGDGGNDRLYTSTADRTSLYGGGGDDTLIAVGGASNDKLYGSTGYDSFWCDTGSNSETTDADNNEINHGHVHRIGSFFACQIDKGNGNVQQLGAPGKTRNGMTLADPLTGSASVGFGDFRADPLFSSSGPSKDDIVQGAIGDCYFMTLMAAIAKVNPDHARQLVCDLGDGTYAVDFKNNNGNDVYLRVDGDLPTWSDGTLAYARFGKQNSIWVPIIEKAWTFYRNEQPAGQGSSAAGSHQGTYQSIEYWHPEYTHSHYDAFNVTANETVVSTLSGGTQLLTQIKNAMDAGKAVWFSGPHPLDSSTPHTDTTHHSFQHAYLVDWVSADHSQIRLRNPYATQGPNGDGYTTISASQAFYCGYDFTTMSV